MATMHYIQRNPFDAPISSQSTPMTIKMLGHADGSHPDAAHTGRSGVVCYDSHT